MSDDLPRSSGRFPTPDRAGPGLMGLLDTYHPSYGRAWFDFADFALRVSPIDHTTREMVRLRCARTNHCRMCSNWRWADPQGQVLPEALTDKIDNYGHSDLSERHKAALRVADVFLRDPDIATAAMRSIVHAYFDDREIVALLLDAMKWSVQKLSVALDLDEGERQLFRFDDDGCLVVEAPLSGAADQER